MELGVVLHNGRNEAWLVVVSVLVFVSDGILYQLTNQLDGD
jgi:hypothetical protein